MKKEYRIAHLKFLKKWAHIVENSGPYPDVGEYYKFFERRNKVKLQEFLNYAAYSEDILEKLTPNIVSASYFQIPNTPIKSLYVLLQFSETEHIQGLVSYDFKNDRFILSFCFVCKNPQFVLDFTEKYVIFEVEVEEQRTVGFANPS